MKKEEVRSMKYEVGKKQQTGRIPPSFDGGLTLLELILALTIFSIVILSGTVMSLSAARMGGPASEENRLWNELRYVFRDMEVNLQDGDPTTLAVDRSVPNQVTLTVRKFDNTPSDPSDDKWVTYTCDYAAGGLTITRSIMQGGTTISTVTLTNDGTLLPYSVLKDFDGNSDIDDNDRTHLETCLSSGTDPSSASDSSCVQVSSNLVLSMTPNKRIIMASFQAQRSMPDGKTVAIPGTTKSIFLRPSGGT